MRALTLMFSGIILAFAFCGFEFATGRIKPAVRIVREYVQDLPAPPLERIVKTEAKTLGIPYAVANCIIEVESSWNPHAVGFNKGFENRLDRADHCLMQVNAQTAKLYGIQDWLTLHTDEVACVRTGMKNLADCHKYATKRLKKSGDLAWDVAAACYNAGPLNLGAGRRYAQKFRNCLNQGRA